MGGERPNGFDSIAALLTALDKPETRARAALTFYRGRTRVGSLDYGELLEHVARVAAYLSVELGIQRGDRVLVLTPNRLEVPVLLLAVLCTGAVAVPINPTTPAEDWAYIARHSGARGVFAAPELLPRLRGVCPGLEFEVDVDGLFEQASVSSGNAGREFGASVSASDLDASVPDPGHGLAIVLYTSGTTGNPKGVGLSQSNLLRNGWSMALNFGLDQTTQFAVLPLYHAHALGFGLMTSLTTGGHLVFTDKLDPFAWCDVIRAESVVYTSVVPSLLPLLLAARVHQDKVPSLRAVLVSSAPLSTELAREFTDRCAIELVQGWGLSEYTNFACCMRPCIALESLLFAYETTSIGGPLTGTEVKVVGLAGETLGEGHTGELCVRGHSRMLEYYREPEATRATFLSELDDGWLRTGDQGHFRVHAGQPIFFVTGRIKEIIIRSGEKYSPLAIEKKLLASLPELEGRLVVLGFAHSAHGEEIGAYLEMMAGLAPGHTAEAAPGHFGELSGHAADLAPVHAVEPTPGHSGEPSGHAPDSAPNAGFAPELRERLVRAIASLPVETRPKVLLYGAAPIPRTHTGKIQRRKLQPLFAEFVHCRGALRIERRVKLG